MRQTCLKGPILLLAAFITGVLGASARQPERGYRGFVDWTNRIYHRNYESAYNGETYSWGETRYMPGISTSHGYQFNPWLFAGAGIDYSLRDSGRFWYKEEWVNHHYWLDNYFLAIFGQARADLQLGKFTPFADIRLGWNADSSGTVYFSPAIGYRFNWGRKVGINLGIGCTLDSYRYERFILGQTQQGLTIAIPTGKHYNWTQSSFTFRVGIDF